MIRIYETFATKELAEEFKERYYKSYHPMGYGTHIAIKEIVIEPNPKYPGESDTRWLASGSRGASCD